MSLFAQYSWITCASERLMLVWSDHGVLRLYLPDESPQNLLDQAKLDFPYLTEAREDIQAAWVKEARVLLQAYWEGKPVNLRHIPLDWRQCPPFFQLVYRRCQEIPAAETLSYSRLAEELGAPKAARAVGQAMRRNPWPLLVPCHRVISKDGGLRAYSAPGGVLTKANLLQKEAFSLSIPQAKILTNLEMPEKTEPQSGH